MDETALLCCGILMEEMADAVLGETGELALTEGEVPVANLRTRGTKNLMRHGTESNVEAAVVPVDPVEATAQNSRVSPAPRKSKRRKVNHHESDGD